MQVQRDEGRLVGATEVGGSIVRVGVLLWGQGEREEGGGAQGEGVKGGRG